MEIKDFENLKKKIESIKDKRSRAEGSLEQVKSQLFEKFKVKTIEEAEELSKKLSKEIESDKIKLEKYLKELDDITEWDKI
jgi:hypothetical protein